MTRNQLSPLLLTAAATVGLSSTPAQAAVVITASEVGGDVVFTGSGTLNLAGLSLDVEANVEGGIDPGLGHMLLGASPASSVSVDLYGIDQVTVPPFGFGTNFDPIVADSGSGDRFGIWNLSSPGPILAVPDGYTSGDPIAGSLTFTGTDFATLGIDPGTYVWSWGSGANFDTLTLNVVPEPGSLALLVLGGLLVTRRRRN